MTQDAASAAFDDTVWNDVVKPVSNGIEAIQAPLSPELAELVRSEHVDALFAALRRRSTFTVVDTSAYVNDAVLRAIECADRLILVTDGNLPSIKSARQLLQLLEKVGIQHPGCLLVLNRAGAELAAGAQEVGTLIGLPVAVEIPNADVLAARTTQHGDPVGSAHPDSTMANRFRELAAILVGNHATPARRRRKRFSLRS